MMGKCVADSEQESRRKPDVSCQNANGTEGYHYYNSSALEIRLSYSGGVINVVYIYSRDVGVEVQLRRVRQRQLPPISETDERPEYELAYPQPVH